MPTIEELVIKAKPDGIDESADEFDRLQGEIEDTTDEMEDATGGLGDLASTWKGAMGAIVAGLALGVGALATQIPILGELMDGLGMIVGALAFKIDQELRPVLQPLTSEMADLATEIYKEEGVLEGLDAIAEKIGDLGEATIELAIEEDVAEVGVNDIITFVFPKMGKTDILSALFSFDLSAAAVLSALFGGLAITASKVLTFLLPTAISATSIVAFVFPVIATAVVLSHVFNINMTKTAILGAIFGGVILTAAAILGVTFSPVVIAGAAIVGTLFAGVTITADMIIGEIVEKNTQGKFNTINFEQSGIVPNVNPAVRMTNRVPERFRASRFDLSGLESGGTNAEFPDLEVNMSLDGRDVTSQTGRYRRDETSRRGRNG